MSTIDIVREAAETPVKTTIITETLHRSGASVREIQVSDPHLTNPEELTRMTADIEAMELLSREYPEDTDLTPVFYTPDTKPALCHWYGFMGKGIALYNLQRPNTTTLGDGLDNPYAAAAAIDPEHYGHRIEQFESYRDTAVDEESRRLFLYAADGRGIRSRAQVFRDVVAEKAALKPGSQFEMLSVACGAALPVYDAAKEVISQGGDPQLSLIDIDLAALNYAHQLAERESLADAVDIRQMNLVDVFMGKIDLGTELSNEQGVSRQFDTIDLLGIFEYFDKDTATIILQKVREATKPGGSIVFGNMLASRPQMEFFRRYVGWRPAVQPRTEDEMLSIVSEAGFDLKNVTLSIPQDGIYAVVEIANIDPAKS